MIYHRKKFYYTTTTTIATEEIEYTTTKLHFRQSCTTQQKYILKTNLSELLLQSVRHAFPRPLALEFQIHFALFYLYISVKLKAAGELLSLSFGK